MTFEKWLAIFAIIISSFSAGISITLLLCRRGDATEKVKE